MKPKNIFLHVFILVLFSSTIVKSQTKDFEGIIKYTYKYESLSLDYTGQDLSYYFGDTSIIYIKNGNYKQVYSNAKGITQVIYHCKSNNYYMLNKNNDTLYFADASSSKQKYQMDNKSSTTKTILNYLCKSITLISQKDTTTYFYASDLAMSSKPFKNHKMGGYNMLTKYIKSVYLEMIYKNENYIGYSKAFSVERIALNDSIFKLPDLPLKKT